MNDWKKLTDMTGGKELKVLKVEVAESGIRVEGEFSLPPLARLSPEDQLFVAVFVKAHGSIKQMEKVFGISYPTVKNRLNKIATRLDIVNVDIRFEEPGGEHNHRLSLLEKLANGEISMNDALKELEQ
jgi:hypothetical protein